ncbi:MAG: hypothetical protein IPK12_07410 [Gemmatimonadetes bacterium]|nr:hypothetical protein [Gemmatimonadota bacterium]
MQQLVAEAAPLREVVVAPAPDHRDVGREALHQAAGPAVDGDQVHQVQRGVAVARDEAAAGAELGADAAQAPAGAEAAPVVDEARLPDGAAVGGPQLVGAALAVLEEQVALPPHQAAVHGEDAVAVAALDAVGVHRAQAGAAAHVLLHPQHVHHRVVVAEEGGGAVVHGGDEAHVGAERAPGQLHGRHRLHQAPGVDQVVGRLEELEPVEEEGPLLREEDRVARVELDLGDVGLDLGEVGVGRGVEGEVVGEAEAHGAAQLRAGAIVVPATGLVAAVEAAHHLGRHVERQPALHPRQPGEPARLRQERGAGPLRGDPRVLEAGMLHQAEDVELPGLLVGRLVAQALERDADLDLVAPRHQPAARLEQEVGREVRPLARPRRAAVEAAAAHHPALGEHPVRLDAERVHREHERLPAVVEGAEEELDVVVGEDAVAVRQRGVNLAVRLARADPQVDGGGRVPDQDLGGVDRRHPVDGLEVREAGQHRRLLPHRLVEAAVDHDRRLHARGRDGQLARAPVVDGPGIGRGHDGNRALQEREQAKQHGGDPVGGGARPGGGRASSVRASRTPPRPV